MKTFPDLPSAGAELYINTTHTFDSDVWWNGTSTFHKWSNHFVDNGLYVYFEIFPFTFRVRPFVGIGKTKAQLQTIVQPFLNELTAKGVPFDFTPKEFPTFYDLYVDLFEVENSGSSALTGGWMFNHHDVATNNDGIIEAFKTVITPKPDRPDMFGFMIGHLFNPGYGLPVSNSATHPSWRNATDFIITVLPMPDGASLATKAELQEILTNTMDEGLRQASTSGCTYVNEVSPRRYWICPKTRASLNNADRQTTRPTPTSPTGRLPSGAPSTPSSRRSAPSTIPWASSMPSPPRARRSGRSLRTALVCARSCKGNERGFEYHSC
jgi:hypothetical protein